MKLFFGKISKNFDVMQIAEGYYQAPKGSSWFGNIDIGDYAYIIGGDKIQFWKAKEWKTVEGNDRFYFEILNSNLGITVNDFTALNFLKLTKALLVLSSRSARNKAFFELELIEDLSAEKLSSTSFYQVETVFRSIKLISEQALNEETKDIQLFFDGRLKLFQAEFYDLGVYTLFRDNLKYLNKGAKNKDGILSKISKNLGSSKLFDRTDISLRSFYDTFFCDYNTKANHFLLGAFWDEHDPQDLTSLFLKEKRWANGYDDKFTKEVSAIPENAYIAIKSSYVKEKKRSVMMIKARGTVVKNYLDGRNLDVEWEADFTPFEVSFGGYMNTVKAVTNEDHISAIWDLDLEEIESFNMKGEYLELLNYKKQIILQGPPGTGKTRLAKELAKMLIGDKLNYDKPLTITNQQIIETLKDVKTISTVVAKADYKLVNVDIEKQQVILEKSTEGQDPTSFDKIRESYYTKSYLGDIQGNSNRRASAIANYIYHNIKPKTWKLENSEQFKLIQFHPSYTYEDFVRGIEAKSNGNQIEYKNVNKILGLFAREAHQNYIDSKKTVEQIKDKISFEEKLEHFKQKVEEAIAKDGKYQIGDTQASILEISDENFTYSFLNNPTLRNNLLFTDLTKLNQLNPHLKTTKEVFELEASLKNKGKQTYYFKVVNAINELKVEESQIETVIQEKNHVLIIDEINRANLSSVLGELIYALEYRGEEVESMYEVDGSNKLILPPNLYIIGTMNTADRSVGHIDYAIRRRFAFADILPKNLEDSEIEFHGDLFRQVAGLFIKNYDSYALNNAIPLENEKEYLSEEFDAKDVWLGHSYFIQKKIKNTTTLEPENFNIRVKYEIVPILREYVKDGILNEKAISIINDIEKSYPVN